MLVVAAGKSADAESCTSKSAVAVEAPFQTSAWRMCRTAPRSVCHHAPGSDSMPVSVPVSPSAAGGTAAEPWVEDCVATPVLARSGRSCSTGPAPFAPARAATASASLGSSVSRVWLPVMTEPVPASRAVHPEALREAVHCAVDGGQGVRITFPDGETISV